MPASVPQSSQFQDQYDHEDCVQNKDNIPEVFTKKLHFTVSFGRSWGFRPTVHPRRGGEHYEYNSNFFNENGSSPQGRGTRGVQRGQIAAFRFIPAGAGNTMSDACVIVSCAVHPRRGGEHCMP